MRYLVSSLIAAVLLSCVSRGFNSDTQSTSNPPLILKNISVVDVESGAVSRATTVMIENGRIAKLSDASLPQAPNARVFDGTGKYLIPGLRDMHVHINDYDSTLPMFVARGVTGVRAMASGDMQELKRIQNEVEQGARIGPRIFGTGNIVEGALFYWPGSYVYLDAQTGRNVVRELKAQGAAFVKPYSLLTREQYLVVADEARRQGLTLQGHAPFSVPLLEVSRSGQVSVEHFYNIAQACSKDEAGFFSYRSAQWAQVWQEVINLHSQRSALYLQLQSTRDPGARDQVMAQLKVVHDRMGEITFDLSKTMTTQDHMAIASYSETACRGVARTLRQNGTFVVPTFSVLKVVPFLLDSKVTSDSRLKYVPKFLRASWERSQPPPAQLAQNARAFWEHEKRITKLFAEEGVKILAGTDLGNPYIFPGESLHDELGHLVDAGLTPLQALQGATIRAAELMKLGGETGKIKDGLRADLVVLDANPLEKISNTEKIDAVILRGRLFEKHELARLERDVEAYVKKVENRF